MRHPNRYPRPRPAVQIPTATMEQEFEAHYRRGFEARGQQLDVEIEALKKQRDQLLAAIEFTLALADGQIENGIDGREEWSDEYDGIEFLRAYVEEDTAAIAELATWSAARGTP